MQKICITYWTPNGYACYKVEYPNVLVALANFVTDHQMSLTDITHISVENL